MMPISYSRSRVLLHWLSAVIILWTLASGFYVAYAPVSAAVEHGVGSFNVSLTTLFIPFFLWRTWLFIRELKHRGTAPSLNKRLAFVVHAMIYLTISVVLVTGVLMMKTAISVFGFVRIPQPLSDPAPIALANAIHTEACVVLLGLVALHLCAVLWHEFSGRRIVRRMSIGRSPSVSLQRGHR